MCRRCTYKLTWAEIVNLYRRPIHMRAKATPFALAGVYDVWKGEQGHHEFCQL
jgi:hypothetical protein